MNGMNAQTGKALSGVEHLQQSIRDIVTTPIGSRVMRRDYGSHLFDLIDAPGNAAALLQVQASIIDALLRHEPRIAPARVTLAGGDPANGTFELDLDAIAVVALDDITPGEALSLNIPLGVI